MPKVSVIIPAYNAAPYIRATIDSVLNSTFKDFEVIVVDDGSTDETYKLLQNISHKVKVIRQENQGLSGARNTGIKNSTGEYIALLDSDDIWHQDKLKSQVEVLDLNPTVGLCFTEFSLWNGVEEQSFPAKLISLDVDQKYCGWAYHHFLIKMWALPSTWLFRKRLAKSI